MTEVKFNEWRDKFLEVLHGELKDWENQPALRHRFRKYFDDFHMVEIFIYDRESWKEESTLVEVLLDYPKEGDGFYNIIAVWRKPCSSEGFLRWLEEQLPLHLMEPPVPTIGPPEKSMDKDYA